MLSLQPAQKATHADWGNGKGKQLKHFRLGKDHEYILKNTFSPIYIHS